MREVIETMVGSMQDRVHDRMQDAALRRASRERRPRRARSTFVAATDVAGPHRFAH